LEATGLAVTVALPTGIEFVEATSGSSLSILDENVVMCPIQSLSRAESATVTLKLRGTSPGILPLTVAVSANQPEAIVSDNRQVVSVTITAP